MSRDSSHHHRKPPRRSPALTAGSMHPRPRDDTPSASDSSPERSGHPSVVKSPHTGRVLKRTRTGPPLVPITYAEATEPLLSFPADFDEEPVKEPLPPPVVTSEEALTALQDELLGCLRSVYPLLDQLDALLHPDASYPPWLAHHTRQIHDRVREDSVVAPAPAPTTYASVTAPHVTTADSHPRPAPPPVTKSTRPDRPSAPCPASLPTKASKQQKASPTPRRDAHHSHHRLILRWTTSPPPINQCAPVMALATVLGDATLEHRSSSHIRGVNWTGSGNLVIHTRAPYTASQLAAVHGAAVIEIVRRECGQFLGPAVLESDTPWIPVVVHGIPARALVDSLKSDQEDFWTALEGTGNGPAEVKAIRVLCRDEDLEVREALSMRLTFSDAGAAKRFLSAGAFLFGTHCRVSRYSPRLRRRPS
ncbi:hypothetical protein B0H11DRAFT_2294901 [Mycena galericulata]|nr:hypothetical protein B0H11DRAFT_2294901 [Mycena galericulata]